MKVVCHFLTYCTLCLVVAQSAGADLQIATAGTTDWQIVRSADVSGVDRYAADTLAEYLQQITGAAFPVLGPNAVNPERPAIFVGLSKPALRHLGRDPLAALENQEHVTRSIGPNIFLYGKGVHGNLHAVMEFLENSLSWRWYSVYEPPVVPSDRTVTLAPFHRTRGFSFKCREVALRYGADFYLQNGINLGLETKLRSKGLDVPPHLVSWLPTDKFVHSSFIIELCAILKREHPSTMVKTLAYRRSQTQIPPALPAGHLQVAQLRWPHFSLSDRRQHPPLADAI